MGIFLSYLNLRSRVLYLPPSDKDNTGWGRQLSSPVHHTPSVAGLATDALEIVREGVEDVLRVVDDDRHLLERARAPPDEPLDAAGDLAGGRRGVLLDLAEGEAGADRGHADGLVARLVRPLERRDDHGSERLPPVDVIDDEDDVAELGAVLAALLGDHRLQVAERERRARLIVEHVARHALDDTVDATEPGAGGVDGGDEGVGLDLGDVTLDEVDGQATDAELSRAIHGSSSRQNLFRGHQLSFRDPSDRDLLVSDCNTAIYALF